MKNLHKRNTSNRITTNIATPANPIHSHLFLLFYVFLAILTLLTAYYVNLSASLTLSSIILIVSSERYTYVLIIFIAFFIS